MVAHFAYEPPSTEHQTSYEVIALAPVLIGASHTTVALASPAVAVTLVETPGASDGVAGTRGADRTLYMFAVF